MRTKINKLIKSDQKHSKLRRKGKCFCKQSFLYSEEEEKEQQKSQTQHQFFKLANDAVFPVDKLEFIQNPMFCWKLASLAILLGAILNEWPNGPHPLFLLHGPSQTK